MRTTLLLAASAALLFGTPRPGEAQFFAPYGYYRPFYRPPVVYAVPPPVYYRPPAYAYAPPAAAYAEPPPYKARRARRARRRRHRAARSEAYQ